VKALHLAAGVALIVLFGSAWLILGLGAAYAGPVEERL